MTHEKLAEKAWEVWRTEASSGGETLPGSELSWWELSSHSQWSVVCAVKAVLSALVNPEAKLGDEL